MLRILLTGGAGFIGIYCLDLLLKKYPTYHIVTLDKLTYASSKAALRRFKSYSNHHFIQGDVTDRILVEALFKEFNFDGVIHLAAESHVDRSIITPLLFVKTNIEGTAVLLDVAYRHWYEKPEKLHPHFLHPRFLYVSTDEVYGPLSGQKQPFVESSPTAPTNPYSASKAAGECLVDAYRHTYGLDTIITRCTNNYGMGQHQEKLIPMIINHALQEKAILLHGDGQMIREWIHAEDHVKAIDLAFHQGKRGETYNITTNERRTNIEITHTICKLLDELRPLKNKSHTSLIQFVEDRPGQDRWYGLNGTKIKETLGWHPSIAFEEAIKQLVASYVDLNSV